MLDLLYSLAMFLFIPLLDSPHASYILSAFLSTFFCLLLCYYLAVSKESHQLREIRRYYNA
jgi:hypothetical protein